MSSIKSLVAALGVSAVSLSAQAALVTYIGFDNSVTSLAQMTNSQAAAAAFDAAVSGATLIDFESALPSGVSISGGTTTNDPNLFNTGCSGNALCGFNTTSGGANFRLIGGGSATFNFATPIDAFGMYITGLQTDLVTGQTITFSDGSTQTINVPNATDGGGAFVGFTDFGQQIVSVTYNAQNDVVALDDVRFHAPEPGTLALLGLAALGFGASRRRRH